MPPIKWNLHDLKRLEYFEPIGMNLQERGWRSIHVRMVINPYMINGVGTRTINLGMSIAL